MTTASERPESARCDLLRELVEDRLVAIANGGDERSMSQLRRLGARDVLVLARGPERQDAARFVSSSRVGANNCTVAILNHRAAFALRSRKFFRNFETIFVPLNDSALFGSIGLARYVARRQLKLLGRVWLDGFSVPLIAFRNTGFADRPRHRVFAPRGMTPLAILQAVSDLDLVALRWIETVETGGEMTDLDLLVRGSAAEEVERRLSQKAGTFPIDLYTHDGSGKRLFKAVPYYPPLVAGRVLDSAVIRDSGVRVPDPLWRYIAYAFHLIFHKSDRLAVGVEKLPHDAFGNKRYMHELWRLAEEAGEPPPASIGAIEELLRRNDAFPELDTIGFYSSKNPFLAARYVTDHSALKPGLGVFIVRDFGLAGDTVDDVRSQLKSRGFEILAEKNIAGDVVAANRIRGGNWIDDQAPGKLAPPLHAFVCRDTKPIPPSRGDQRRYPRLDNANMLLKVELRTAYANQKGNRKLNMIHASDNSAEAQLYAEALGLTKESAVAAIIAEVTAPVAG